MASPPSVELGRTTAVVVIPTPQSPQTSVVRVVSTTRSNADHHGESSDSSTLVAQTRERSASRTRQLAEGTESPGSTIRYRADTPSVPDSDAEVTQREASAYSQGLVRVPRGTSISDRGHSEGTGGLPFPVGSVPIHDVPVPHTPSSGTSASAWARIHRPPLPEGSDGSNVSQASADSHHSPPPPPDVYQGRHANPAEDLPPLRRAHALLRPVDLHAYNLDADFHGVQISTRMESSRPHLGVDVIGNERVGIVIRVWYCQPLDIGHEQFQEPVVL